MDICVFWEQREKSFMTSCVSRKYRRAQSIAKLVLTLDDIVFIDTQVSRKVRVLRGRGRLILRLLR